MLTLRDVNAMGRELFAERLGHLFERSPWVAEQAWDARPFADRGALHAALCAAVARAPRERQLALIRAHPDLAGRAAVAGELTPDSTREQSSAGLDRLSAEEFARFTRLNAAYRERFGFPFVVCVREHDRRSILAQFEARLRNGQDAEVAAALAEVGKIAWLRLLDAVADEGGERA